MTARSTIVVEHEDKSPLTLADLRELLAAAEKAGVDPAAQLQARVSMGGKLKRIEVR